MSRNLSNAAKQAIFAQETAEVFILLVTISHPNFLEDIRVSSDPTDILPIAGERGTVSRGLEYVYCPFTINLPIQDDTGIARANISIDNVGREAVDAVRSADSALSITTEIVLASQPDEIEVSAPDFRLERVAYDALTISGDISVEYFDLEPYPCARQVPSLFQGLF